MIMSQLRHPGILLLMGVCTEPNNIALVMEYVEGKSLDKILANKEINFTNAQKVKLAMDIAAACHWLHCLDPPIIHRDIKPANILVDRNFKVSVCDFGLSCVKETPNPFDEPRDEVVGSPLWMAPEVLQGWPNTEKSDVYAFALVLWEVFTRMPPNIGVDNVRRLVKDVVNKARRPPLPDDLFPPLRQLIKNAWDQNPDRRPDFAEIREILKSIFVDMVIFDPVGNAMWRALEKKEAIEEHWPMSVAWDDFAHELFSLLGQSTEGLNRSNDIGYLCLRTLLSERYQDLTSSQQHSKLKVTAERFGNFLECFGPLTDENATYNIVERFKRICENEWFHGNLSFEDSELRLRGKPQGSFLVRLSSTNACFTISKVNLNGSITHQRIVRANGRYITQVNEHQMKESDSLPGIIEAVKNDINLIHPCGDGRLFGILFNTIESGGYLKMNPNLVLSLSSSTLSPSSSSPTLPPSISSPSLQPPTPQPPKKEQPAPQQQRAPSGLPPAMSKEKRTAMERMYDSYEVMREEIMEQVEEVAEDDEDSDSSDADAEDSEEEEEGSSGSDSEEEEGTEDAEQSQPERQSQSHVEEVEEVEDSDEESDSDEDSDDERETSKESGAAAKPKSRLLNGGDKQQQPQQQKTNSNGQLSPHSACSSPKKASPASSSRSCIDLSLHSSNSLLAQKNFMKKFQQKQLQKSGSTNVSPPSPTRGRTTSLTTRSPTSLPSRAADSNRNKEGTKLTQSGSLVALNNHVHNIHNATKRFASKKGLSPSGAASRPK
ncbi:non-specific serine/threonine protein kinase [Balamuthia mandrillaris]